MSSLAARLDEIIVLYTMGRTVRQIADRYGASAITIKTLLLGAGVELRARPGPRQTGAGSRSIRGAYKPIDIAQADRLDASTREESDRAHVEAVARALRGKGFPFLAFRSAA
jgi:type III secretory pathway component EscV